MELVLQRFYDVAGANATGADLDARDRSLPEGLYLLQVGMPGPASLVVGVTDVVTEAGTLAAYFTYFGHVLPLTIE